MDMYQNHQRQLPPPGVIGAAPGIECKVYGVDPGNQGWLGCKQFWDVSWDSRLTRA